MQRYFNFLTLTLACALASTTLTTDAQAQRKRGAAQTPAATRTTAAATGLVNALPTSDAVLTVDVRRLLTEALPRVHSNAAELAQVNAEIDKFQAQTGIDARSFNQLAVGVSYTTTAEGKTKVETVALARGTFNPATLISAARAAAKVQGQEEKYAGKTINIFSVNERVRLLGLFNLHVTDVAVAALDANTLAIGKLERVRAAIDANAGRGRVAANITSLAAQDANAIVAAGGNIPASLTRNLDIGNLSKSIASVRQFYSTLGTTTEGFNMLTVLRTEKAADAQALSTTIASLKQIAPMFIGGMRPERARPLQGLVDNTKVSAEGVDVRFTLDVAQGDVTALMRAF